MAAPSPGHLYQPLDDSRREIRVVSFNHRDADGTLHFDLSTISLDQKPSYWALSYCWTTKQATETIFINGCTFLVRPNLNDYLRILCDEEDHRSFFIDVICINQDDLEERSSQVRLMGNVYRGAQGVVAWLGLPQSEEQAERLRHASAMLTDLERARQEDGKWGSKKVQSLNICNIIFLLESSEYWRRLWITQGLLLAKSIVLRMGSLVVDRATLRAIMDKSGFSTTDRSIYWSLMQATVFSRLNIIRLAMADDSIDNTIALGTPLAVPLFWTMHQSCSNSKDHVYGVFGLCGTCIDVDYNMRPLELGVRFLLEARVQAEIEAESDGGVLALLDVRLPVVIDMLFERMGIPPRSIVVTLAKDQILGPSYYLNAVPTKLAHNAVNVLPCPSRDHMGEKYLSKVRTGIMIDRATRKAGLWRIPYVIAKTRLQWCEKRNTRLRAPDAPDDQRSYDEWVVWLDTIAEDVLRRMSSESYDSKHFAHRTWAQMLEMICDGDSPLRSIAQGFIHEPAMRTMYRRKCPGAAVVAEYMMRKGQDHTSSHGNKTPAACSG